MWFFLLCIIFAPILDWVHCNDESVEGCPKECLCDLLHWSDLAINQYIRPDAAVEEKLAVETNQALYYDHYQLENNPLTKMVMCVLQPSRHLETLLEEIPSDVESLTILQGSGNETITLKSGYLLRLSNLKVLEVKGTPTFNTSLVFSIDVPLDGLIYLNLVNIRIEHSKDAVQLKRIFSNEIPHEAENTVAFKLPNNTNEILPYEEYIAQQKLITMPIFKGHDDLVLLRLSGCQLNELAFEMFDGLNKLRFLYLDDNKLKFIPEFAFYGVPILEVLSLAKNSLLDITITELSGLLELEYLDLSSNNFSQLSELSFPPFPKLKLADFRNNPIHTIYPNTFEVMNTTRSIILGNVNTPVVLAPNAFIGLSRLETLKVFNLRIALLKRDLFRGVKNLVELSLTGNINEIEYDTFLDLNKLEILTLSHCKIEYVSIDAFFGLEKLSILDLSGNKLTHLPPGIFDPLTSIQEIMLNDNSLKELPLMIFHGLHAKMIRLNGNPWHCSCMYRFWTPAVVNKIKRVQPKVCRHEYDKGISCDQQQEVEYIYDRRVAPICNSPMEYKRLGVFHVVYKKMRCHTGKKRHQKLTKKVRDYIANKKVHTADQIGEETTIESPLSNLTTKYPHLSQDVSTSSVVPTKKAVTNLYTITGSKTSELKDKLKLVQKLFRKEKHLKQIKNDLNRESNMINNSI